MFAFSSRSLRGVLPRPIVRIILFCIVLIILFVALLHPHTDASHHLENVTPVPPRHHQPQPILLHPEGPSLHRINFQRPLAEPASADHIATVANDGPWAQRADAVRAAFLHAYQAYLTYAAPHDELRPLSKAPVDNFNGWGLSIVESLDTMWLMGLYDQFDAALAFVANATFPLEPEQYAPFFETVIRYLGGLLSAYALSRDPILIFRADELGTALLPAFRSPSGLPRFSVNTVDGKVDKGRSARVALSEAFTCQLEYKYLSYLTGRKGYYDAVEKIMDIMYKTNVTSTGELFPLSWSTKSGLPVNRKVSVGARGDSAYEYLLKQWLLTGRTDTKARDLYLRSMNAILDHLTYLTPFRNLLYVTDATVDDNGIFSPYHKFDHLTCFLPAVLALGAVMIPDAPRRHMWAARGLAHTCWMLYADSPSGLAPEEVLILSASGTAGPSSFGRPWITHLEQWEQSGGRGDPPGVQPPKPMKFNDYRARGYSPTKTPYLLRPETVESFYLLWRTTGDVVWRERGWEVFEALQREARVEGGGFASVEDAHRTHGPKLDEMPSYFLAETLKYLFLLFTDEDLIPLDQWVFNTEAHPLPVFYWSEWEMERFGIARGIYSEKDVPRNDSVHI